MLKRVGLVTLALASLASSRSMGAQVPQDSAAWPSQFAEIDRYAEAMLRADRVPGASVAIVHRDRLVHLRSFGVDQRERAITGSTSFVLGSMSKSITAVAVMQLVERGKVVLDAPVRSYLPTFRVASPDSGASITIRHLLLHTSGLPHGVARGTRQTLSDHIAALRTVAPERAPGVAHSYASPNYLVLGGIVEAVSGQPFGQYVEQNIFGPLGMRGSFTDRAQAISSGFAGGHVYAFGFPITSTLDGEPDRLPTAGLMSSAEDLARFLTMFLQHGRVGGEQFLRVETVGQIQTGNAPADGFSYAFGWREGRIGGTRAVHHGGIVPDFRGKMVMLPDAGWGVVVLTNASSAIPWPLTPTSHRLADDIAARLVGQPLPPAESRHQMIFALIAAGMGILLLMQVRTLVREARLARRSSFTSGASGRVWRAGAIDVLFLIGIVLLPGFVGLRWADLFSGGPDLAWWLVAMGSLGAMTVVGRLVQLKRLGVFG